MFPQEPHAHCWHPDTRPMSADGTERCCWCGMDRRGPTGHGPYS